MRKVIVMAALVAMLPVGAATAEEATPQSENDKTLYALGFTLAGNLAPFSLTPEEVQQVQQGLVDGALGREPKTDVAAQRANFQKLAQSRMEAAAAKEKERGKEFLAKAANEEGAVKSDSGLIYKETKAGEGATPKATDRVTVHYTGKLTDGTVFDSSVERGTPATFPLNGVIPCWTEGVQKIKVGGKAQLICPSDIAYGDRGSPPRIQPGATLVFDVELIEIAAEPATPKMPPGHP